MISFGGLFLANPGPPPRHRWIVQHPGPSHLLRRRRARLHRLSPSLRLSIQLRTYQGHPVNTRGPAPQASLSRWSGRAIRPSAASQLGHTCRPHRRRERRISRSGPGRRQRGDTRRCTGVRIPRRGAKSARAKRPYGVPALKNTIPVPSLSLMRCRARGRRKGAADRHRSTCTTAIPP
jgi:hypothetical protein